MFLQTNNNDIYNKYFFIVGPLFGARYVQILLITYCILVGISTRGSFAVQIVAMTSQNATSSNPDIPVSLIDFLKP